MTYPVISLTKIKLACLALTLLVLSACSDSGPDVEENPVPPPPPSNDYKGPPPQTDDIAHFKLAVWDELSASNRCGQCHGVSQAPAFVNLNDVNLAYAEANKLVNRDIVSESLLVQKVAGGHNCWLPSTSACADILLGYLNAWIGGSAASSTEIELVDPTPRTPGSSRTFPTSSDLFAATLYPLLRQRCAGCHDENAANPIAPYFASADVDAAYAALQSKIDLDNPSNSRLVVRLSSEFHNCWSDCGANGDEMLARINEFAEQIPLTQIDPDLLVSNSLFLTDGIIASGGGRFDADTIALWNFKTGKEFTAFDTSGVEPAANLTLSGDFSWVGGWGIQLKGGKAQASTQSSKKLHDLITATGEYSIEAWVTPGNVTQEGPARIISYSASLENRNFTLGQTLYNYDFLNRTQQTNANGDPALSTDDDDEVLQTALQHVVATFSPAQGRKIYLNGELVAQEDLLEADALQSWNDTYALIMGNEASGDRPWLGTLRMAAIHNRNMTPEQIKQNFDAGVGEKFFMLFGISHLIGVERSYIGFTVAQFDSYSYLFTNPFFIKLGEQVAIDEIDLQKMRIGINGKQAKTGQAYSHLQTKLGGANYNASGQALSALGTVIALEKGTTNDEFFLTFEKIAAQERPFIEPEPPAPAAQPDLAERPHVGLRDFYEIHASMASVTGVSMTEPTVNNTYLTVKQQLPTLTDIDVFNSSQQMGVTQLAIAYCNALVEDQTLRSSYFAGFDFNALAQQAFNSTAKRDQIFDPLMTKMVGDNLLDQPSGVEIKTELNNLTDKLTACGANCSADRTQVVVKAVCAAVLGSGAVLIQ